VLFSFGRRSPSITPPAAPAVLFRLAAWTAGVSLLAKPPHGAGERWKEKERIRRAAIAVAQTRGHFHLFSHRDISSFWKRANRMRIHLGFFFLWFLGAQGIRRPLFLIAADPSLVSVLFFFSLA
jgi:hypothetical protein